MGILQLMEGYQPKNLAHRDEQIKTIKMVFKNYCKYETASNLILLGVTGSGKTTTIKKIISDIEGVIYVSASQLKSSFKIIRELFKLNSNQIDKVLSTTIEKLKIEKKVLVLDELNKVGDISNLFDDLNTIYRETGIPIILITNNQSILDDMPEDARLTLFFEKVRFNSYNAQELYDIAKDRLKELSPDFQKMIPQTSLKYICAHSAKEGSARTMLGLVRRCIVSHNFSEEYIDKLIKTDEKEEWVSFIRSLNTTEKRFLELLIDIYSKNSLSNNPITAHNIQEGLSKYELSPARISQLITTFEEDYGIIKTHYINKGRGGGKYRVLEFSSPEMFNKLVGIT